MSFRPGFRAFNAFRANFTQYTRRNASTATGAEPAGFQKFWNSPIGPKTVHFWYALSPSLAPHTQSLRWAAQCTARAMPYLRPLSGLPTLPHTHYTSTHDTDCSPGPQ